MEGETSFFSVVQYHKRKKHYILIFSLSWLLLSVYNISSQQAFNATAVIRHMRRLQLGTSFGSSISSSSSVSSSQSRGPAKSQSVDCAPLSLKDCEWHFTHDHVSVLAPRSAQPFHSPAHFIKLNDNCLTSSRAVSFFKLNSLNGFFVEFSLMSALTTLCKSLEPPPPYFFLFS